jgi:two-component system nitrate/nitrite response regulator NarL
VSDLTVLVVDDHPLFREGVIRSVQAQDGLTVVGQASDMESGLKAARALLPDIVLQDVKLPDGSGVDTVSSLKADCPYSKVIVLTAVEDEETLIKALKAGASGYVLKGVSATSLVDVIRAVAAGETYVTPKMAVRLLREMGPLDGKELAHDLSDLSERERSILELVGEGLTNREVGERLFLSEKTVKHYMTNILQKLQVRNRVEAALLLNKGRRDS